MMGTRRKDLRGSRSRRTSTAKAQNDKEGPEVTFCPSFDGGINLSVTASRGYDTSRHVDNASSGRVSVESSGYDTMKANTRGTKRVAQRTSAARSRKDLRGSRAGVYGRVGTRKQKEVPRSELPGISTRSGINLSYGQRCARLAASSGAGIAVEREQSMHTDDPEETADRIVHEMIDLVRSTNQHEEWASEFKDRVEAVGNELDSLDRDDTTIQPVQDNKVDELRNEIRDLEEFSQFLFERRDEINDQGARLFSGIEEFTDVSEPESERRADLIRSDDRVGSEHLRELLRVGYEQ